MKSEEEKKSRRVSMRMTQEQFKLFQSKAEKRNQSVSAYVVESALHGDRHITPLQVMRLQNDFNEAADALETVNPKLAAEIRGKGDAVWALL